jgi:hypothetical protein
MLIVGDPAGTNQQKSQASHAPGGFSPGSFWVKDHQIEEIPADCHLQLRIVGLNR